MAESQKQITHFQELPNEIMMIVIRYFDVNLMKKLYFHMKKYKYIMDYYIQKYDFKEEARHLNITIPEKYIITRGNISQLVIIDDKYSTINKNGKKNTVYEFYYGQMGFHEGFTLIDNIRELTDEEKNYSYWELPQQFNQSTPFDI